jgi:hypothetical protein
VLAARGDPFPLERADDGGAEARDVLGALGQRAIADHRVLRVGVHVEDRRVVERDADRVQFGRERLGEPLGQLLVVRLADPAERGHRRPLRERTAEPRHTAAFLIDADPERKLGGERLRLARQIGDLLRRLDVAREEDHAAEIELAGEGAHLGRHRVPLESNDRELANVTSDVTHAIPIIAD